MFIALKPIYHRIPGDLYAVTWETLGICVDMADAKRKWGGYPVLEKFDATAP